MFNMSLIWDGVRVVISIDFSACSRLEMLVIASCSRILQTIFRCMTPVVTAYKSLSDAVVD
jgi:hypothetical protein